ncbi:MAG: alanine--tRNA ligase [Candidatus Paceibacterota bacterium]
MSANEIRNLYLEFFKNHGHAIIPSASLIPENDPTTLFTGSGMQPMLNYLLGEKHPLGVRIADSQKCFRTQDMEEVGDNRHTTFFEMLGNWSLGDYFKKEQIGWIFEFLTKKIELDPGRIYVSVFRGDEKLGVSRDTEAVDYWKEQFAKVNIEAKDIDFAERDGMQGGRIFYYGTKKNWWARVINPEEMPIGEPGGPDSEIFWDFGPSTSSGQARHDPERFGPVCHVNCDCGRFLEIGNNVFMQYIKTEKGFELLPKGNIDFGGGLERVAAAKNGNPDIFTTDLFAPLINKIEELSGNKYKGNEYSFRVIADHIKAATFILGDERGLAPSNAGAGYVLRRLIRRAVRNGFSLGIKEIFTSKIAEEAIKIYSEVYLELGKNKKFIINQLDKEENKFKETLEQGLKEFSRLEKISGLDAFNLYQTYGFPFEITKELAKEKGIEINEEEFKNEMQKHQELSRTASAGMFKGGLADASEQTIKYHTAAHLMLAALRKVFGENVLQKGSNITSERLRFDFSHPEKMTPEQIKQVEDLVNEKIKADLPVVCEEMSLDEAKEKGAMGVFDSKYGERVKVYSIDTFSKEICGGPHVNRTSELGKFKIVKEESASAGVRRIKAVLE